MRKREGIPTGSAVLRQQGEDPQGDSAEHPVANPGQKEALDFVEKNRDLFEHVARGQVHLKPAPPGLDTFAIDLKTDDLYISPRFYKKKGFSEEMTAFATMHEIEHLLEKKKLLAEKDGPRTFDRYLARIQKSRAYKVMDNCIADIRENETVVDKTSDEFAVIEQKMYKEYLFENTDFTDQPKHLQLPMAMLREARVPDEICTVAPEVRSAIDEIKAVAARDGTTLMDVITHPDTPMSSRLRIQDRFILPKVEQLLEQDTEEDKKKKGEGEPADDPNKRFEKAYDKVDAQMPHAVPIDQIKKALKEWKEAKGNPLDTADQEYANALGVKKEELQRYRELAEQMHNIRNPETNQSVIDDLRDLIARIIAKRQKERPAPQYPVEEGDELADPAELVTQVKVGNFEPKVWETQEIKVQKGKRFGTVEITLVGDRSTSMQEGSKGIEQQKAVVLFMEALNEFAELARVEAVHLDKPLSVKSEIYTFQSSNEDAVPLKRMSEDLSEKDRINVAAKVGTFAGSTTDFVPLESVSRSVNEETQRAIQEGELKKIVIVFTDGGSDNVPRVATVLERLRSQGVVVVGIGITESGAPALTTYAPGARLAETADKLASVLAETLREHLADV